MQQQCSIQQHWQPDEVLGYHIPGFGVVLTLAILLIVGGIASNFVGRKLVAWGDALVSRIPVVRSIYSSVKQVSDTLFSESGNAFRTAVMVQWPHPGMWTIGFVTGAPSGELDSHLHQNPDSADTAFVSVYVPTTPNPTSGYLEIVPVEKLTPTDWTVDEAMAFIISGGAVSPDSIPFDRPGAAT